MLFALQVRLILPPLLDLYSIATNCGEASLSLAFQMLASLVSTMDRLAVGTYHVKVYEHCLAALDIRRQHPDSLKNINMVEQSIIHAIITLTLKLTEGTFRPLFLRTLEWADSEVDQSSSKKSLDRAIVFYKLINKLAEQHRYIHLCNVSESYAQSILGEMIPASIILPFCFSCQYLFWGSSLLLATRN